MLSPANSHTRRPPLTVVPPVSPVMAEATAVGALFVSAAATVTVMVAKAEPELSVPVHLNVSVVALDGAVKVIA